MQEPSSENQLSVDASEGRFTTISKRELNFLLESRLSRSTKNSTFMAVPTFKGRYQNKIDFKIHTFAKDYRL